MKVVIIGAGVAGLSIGWRLRQADVEVVLLERAQPAFGATWAAAGMISSSPEPGSNRTLDAFARGSADRWPQFAAEIEYASGRPVRFQKNGKLVIARNERELEHLSEVAACNPAATVLSAAESRALEPMLAEDVLGAMSDPTDAQVDNRALGAALVGAFVRAGGQLQANEAAVRIENDGKQVLG